MDLKFAVLSAFLIMTNQFSAQTTKTLNIAHRGASGSAPENTLASFNKAIEIGADVVELDVHLSSDGELIIIHDHTLDRTTDLKGEIKNHTLKEIKKADAGSWFNPEFKNERVPTLDEVLFTVNGRAKVMIELKEGNDVYQGIEKKTLECLKRNGAETWCELQSFRDTAVNNLLTLTKTVPVYKLVVGNVPALPLYHDGEMHGGSAYQFKNVAGINPNYRFARKRILKKLHQRNQKMYVWTVNDEKMMKKLLHWGVDGIITNFPEKLKALQNQ